MASDINVCTVLGRVTKDAVLEHVGAKQTALCKFSIANNTGSGAYEHTNFFNVQIWGKQGEILEQYLTKGKQVLVSGPLECNKYEAKDGTNRESWVITASQVSLLASPKNDPLPQPDEGSAKWNPPINNCDGGIVF